MKAQAVLIKRSTLLSAFFVGIVIAVSAATNVRAETVPTEAQVKIV